MYLKMLALCCLVVGFASCGNKKQTEAEEATTDTRGMSEAEDTPTKQTPEFRSSSEIILDMAMFRSEVKTHNVNEEPWVEGDKLHIPVRYSGCDPDTTWSLVGQTIWMKSLPPQKSIRLIKGLEMETCRMAFVDTLIFDLTPARYPGHNRVILNLLGDREFRIEYVYDSE